MSEVEVEREVGGEGAPAVPGEGVHRPSKVVIVDKKLTFEEASKGLSNLGKDETGMRYAYLKMSATDRKLTDVAIIQNFRHVLFVDVSGNYLNLYALQALAQLPFLVQLQAQRNFVEDGALEEMTYLQDLNLSRNQITQTVGICQPQLEFLDLNYNQIYEAVFEPNGLPEIKVLEMRGNFLYECGGLLPETVEKLYLAENRITRVVGADMERLRSLQVLHLRNNQIRKLRGFGEQLSALEYLNLRQNKIGKLRQFRWLSCLKNLNTLVISQNPVAGEFLEQPGEDKEVHEDEDDDDDEEQYGEDNDAIDPKRVALLVLMPGLIRINKVPVGFEERETARQNREAKYREIMAEDSSDEEIDATSTTTEHLTEMDPDETPADGDAGEEDQ